MKSALGKRSTDERVKSDNLKLETTEDDNNQSPGKKPALSATSASSNSSKGSFGSDDTDVSIDTSVIKNNAIMSKVSAAQIIDSLTPPKRLKEESHYMRFKNRLTKDAKTHKDIDTIKNITTVAKQAWNQVKCMSVSASSNEDVTFGIKSQVYLLSLKKRAVTEEVNESRIYKAESMAFCNAFKDAAIAYLYWNTKECTIENAETLKCAIRKIEHMARGIGFLPGYYTTMHTARTKLESVNNEIAIQDIAVKLRTATDEILYEMARDYHHAKWQRAELRSIKRHRAAQKKNDSVEASTIRTDIISDLKKQMIYTSSRLKKDWRRITYSRNGVTQEMFANTFKKNEYDALSFTPTAKIDGHVIGMKKHYSNLMGCQDVDVKLKGNTLTASTKYGVYS
jgi:hypothetical protein